MKALKNVSYYFYNVGLVIKKTKTLSKFLLGLSLTGSSVYLINHYKPFSWSSPLQSMSILSLAAASTLKEPIHPMNVVADVVDKVYPSIVSITVDKGPIGTFVGAGFIVDESGYLVTSKNAIGKNPVVYVRLQNGNTYCGEVVEFDNKYELALVKINPVGVKLKALKFANKSTIRQGEFIIAFGNTMVPITVGIISTLERRMRKREDLTFVQTNAVTTIGNYGGPLVNLYGEVIGVNTVSPTSGLGFAIPGEYCLEFVESAYEKLKSKILIDGSHIKVSSIEQITKESDTNNRFGIIIGNLTQQIVATLKNIHTGYEITPNSGVIIHSVIEISASKKSGLFSGDIIETINGRKVNTTSEFTKLTTGYKNIEFKVIRRGKTLVVKNEEI